MKFNLKIVYKSIGIISLISMLFSCTNSTQEVRDFLAEKNLPIGVAENVFYVYKDSGRISSKLKTPLLYDYSNRKRQPYNEFPKGVKIITFQNKGNDSILITGNYALSYTKTSISEIKGNVIIINYKQKSKLQTEQLFWNQKSGYLFSEKKFKFTTQKDTINGVGFESKEDLSKWIATDIIGNIKTKNIY